jgi:hypothetical protein
MLKNSFPLNFAKLVPNINQVLNTSLLLKNPTKGMLKEQKSHHFLHGTVKKERAVLPQISPWHSCRMDLLPGKSKLGTVIH